MYWLKLFCKCIKITNTTLGKIRKPQPTAINVSPIFVRCFVAPIQSNTGLDTSICQSYIEVLSLILHGKIKKTLNDHVYIRYRIAFKHMEKFILAICILLLTLSETIRQSSIVIGPTRARTSILDGLLDTQPSIGFQADITTSQVASVQNLSEEKFLRTFFILCLSFLA